MKMNIVDELSLATNENREAYARLMLHADSVIRFIDAIADEDIADVKQLRMRAQSLMHTLSKPL